MRQIEALTDSGVQVSRHEQWFREAWVEKVPAPLDMTDTEILDFMSDEVHGVEYIGHGQWTVKIWNDSEGVYMGPLRDALKQAAACWREMNA